MSPVRSARVDERSCRASYRGLLDFFVVFSQFEYAHKRAGYVEDAQERRDTGPPSPDERRPVVDWEGFRIAIKRGGAIFVGAEIAERPVMECSSRAEFPATSSTATWGYLPPWKR
jgi:hypothetical protein